MRHCQRTARLEALVVEGLGDAQNLELDAHALQCPRCKHELGWLRAERALFAERAGRAEVAALWSRLDSRTSTEGAARGLRVAAAMAAMVLVLFGLGNGLDRPGSAGDSGITWTEGWEPSEVATAESREHIRGDECSRLPTGIGFFCQSPASFVTRW